jgi:hypothetical protein
LSQNILKNQTLNPLNRSMILKPIKLLTTLQHPTIKPTPIRGRDMQISVKSCPSGAVYLLLLFYFPSHFSRFFGLISGIIILEKFPDSGLRP